MSKATEKFEKLLDHIHQTYGFSEFTFTQVSAWLLEQKIHTQYFFHLAKGGVLTRAGIEKGSPYKLVEYGPEAIQKGVDAYTAASKAQADAAKLKRKEGKPPKEGKQPPVITEETILSGLTEELAVQFLKEKHYKIYAPILTYTHGDEPL